MGIVLKISAYVRLVRRGIHNHISRIKKPRHGAKSEARTLLLYCRAVASQCSREVSSSARKFYARRKHRNIEMAWSTCPWLERKKQRISVSKAKRMAHAANRAVRRGGENISIQEISRREICMRRQCRPMPNVMRQSPGGKSNNAAGRVIEIMKSSSVVLSRSSEPEAFLEMPCMYRLAISSRSAWVLAQKLRASLATRHVGPGKKEIERAKRSVKSWKPAARRSWCGEANWKRY